MGRNQWIPQRTAEYVPQAQIRTLRLSNTPIERDPAFGLDLPDVPVENKDIRSIQSTMKPTVRIEQLTPERKAELITIFLPATLVFNRPVVENSTNQAIYGSVSIQDIAAHVRQSLAHNPEASRVLVTDFEARFVLPEGKKSPDARKTPDGEELEDDKVKHLGEYEVEIQVHGSGDIIKRKVRVLPNTPDKSE
jgi:ribosomal protein L9